MSNQPTMSYPIRDTLAEEEVNSLIRISKIFRDCLIMEMDHPELKLYCGSAIDAREMVKNNVMGQKLTN